MQCGDLWLYPLSGAAVVNNVIRHGEALLARGLGGENALRLLAADAVARDGASQLGLSVDVDHQHPIGAILQAVFHQQRHHPQCVRAGRLRQLALGLAVYQRMQ